MYNDSLFRVSLKCLIRNSAGNILVVKENGRGSYDLPGGGIEHGEDIRSAIARELNEEISYEGDFEYQIISADDPAKLRTRDVWQIKLLFKVNLKSLNVSAGKDAEEIAFIDPNTFKNSAAIPEQKIFEYANRYY